MTVWHYTFLVCNQSAAIACTVGGSATPAARSARPAAALGVERSMKRRASCSTSVSVVVEVGDDSGPGSLVPERGNARLQFGLEHECQEAAEHICSTLLQGVRPHRTASRSPERPVRRTRIRQRVASRIGHTLILCGCALFAALASISYLRTHSLAGLLCVALLHAAMLGPIAPISDALAATPC